MSDTTVSQPSALPAAAPWREVFLAAAAAVRVGQLPAPHLLGRSPAGLDLICATEGDLELWLAHVDAPARLLGWAVHLEAAPAPPSSTSMGAGWPILGPHTIDQRRAAGLQ